jgi:hypothetical protein
MSLMSAKLTTEQFIKKAKEVHGNKYNYDKVIYEKTSKKIIITCPIHGDFQQTPNSHKYGQGCPKCGIIISNDKKTLSQQNLICKFSHIHKDKYSYEKTVYVNRYTKIIITCPIHGDFQQTPLMHSQGHGCVKCQKSKKDHGNIINQDFFIEKCRKIHGNKYSYEKTIYNGVRNEITISCPIHGDFQQIAGTHLYGCGCSRCSREKQSKNTLLKFSKNLISRFHNIHGNLYNYDKVKYCGMHEKVTITCSIHGDFEQLPYNHIYNESCCPKCVKTYFRTEEEFRQFIQSLIPSAYKTAKGEIIPKQELDVYIPSRKIAFEFQGEYWHKHHHVDTEERDERKRQSCKNLGIKLYEIWENDWNNNREEIKRKVTEFIFGLPT